MIQLTNEQKMIENEVKKFAKSELEPVATEIDNKGVFPSDIVEKLSNLGLSSLIIPEQYGGADLDATSLCIAVEELAKVCASISLIFAVNNCLVAYPIMKYGSENQKDKYLKRLVNGEIGGYAIETGFSASEHERNVPPFEFVMNGAVASFIILPVSSEKGKLLYIHDRSKEDRVGKHRILGMRAAGITSLDVEVSTSSSDSFLAAQLNQDVVFKDIQNYSDIIFSAMSLGIAEAAYEAALKYSKERRQFGRAICHFPMVQEMLVKMRTKIAASKLLVYNAAAQVDLGQDHSLSAHIARLFVGEFAVNCGLDAIQVHGGYGYIKEYPVERHMRDAKAIQIINATPIDLKAAFAKELL